MVESMFAAQRFILGNAGERKRLAGKSGTQDVMIRNGPRVNYVSNVPVGNFTEIVGIGLLRVCVPFAGEDTFPATILHGNTKAANAREQIDKGKCGLGVRREFDSRLGNAVGSQFQLGRQEVWVLSADPRQCGRPDVVAEKWRRGFRAPEPVAERCRQLAAFNLAQL